MIVSSSASPPSSDARKPVACATRSFHTAGAKPYGNGNVSALLKKYGFSDANLFFFPIQQ